MGFVAYGVTNMNMERNEASTESPDDNKPPRDTVSQRTMDEMRLCNSVYGSVGASVFRNPEGGHRVMCNVVDSVGGVSQVLPPLHLMDDGTGSRRPQREGHGRF